MTQRLALVGNFQPFHLGAHLRNAAQALGFEIHSFDLTAAFAAPALLQKFNWWLRGHRPSHLDSFSRAVVNACAQLKPHCVLTTGLAPLNAQALDALGDLGVQRVNFLTDDPWNPAHRAPWFMKALPKYDHVFSPRRANMDDLKRHGCKNVHYLPFGYAPEIHFREAPAATERRLFESDVVFAGGADPDRFPYFAALIDAGLNVALYGGYWDKDPKFRPFARGHIHGSGLRKAIGTAKISLCLVRRANRDAHAMRSFEVPAMGGCILVEDTTEHRQIFGEDGDAVVYFREVDDMLAQARRLVLDAPLRTRLSERAHRLIMAGGHTYSARLQTVIQFACPEHNSSDALTKEILH